MRFTSRGRLTTMFKRVFSSRILPDVANKGVLTGVLLAGGLGCGGYIFAQPTAAKAEDPYLDLTIWNHADCLKNTADRNPTSREKDMAIHPDISTLPTIPLEEVRRVANSGERVWVTYKGGVFDITNFTKAHPGGFGRIMMANGNDLSKFWEVYKLHNRPHIQYLVQDFRIGNLSPSDAKKSEEETQFTNMWVDEPKRPRSVLRVASDRPWNAGPRLHEFHKTFFTPNELHYTRSHHPCPRVDPEEYIFTVNENKELGITGREFSLKELKTLFPKHHVPCTLQCAGGRQEDFVVPDRPLYVEAKWREEAWGTALWGGAKIRDILTYCGMDMDALALGRQSTDAKILNAWAIDADETGKPYASWIPFGKVIDPFGDAIIAYEMNGEDLPRDHGYPCRLLSPGYAGFRNVKWVEEISVEKGINPECDQKNQHFGPNVSFRGHYIPGKNGEGPTPDLMNINAPRVVTVPVYSTITTPGQGQVYPGDVDEIEITGIAWSGCGRGINRVEVSVDGGNDFRSAEFLEKPPVVADREPDNSFGLGRAWTWTQWKRTFPITPEMKTKLSNGERVVMEVVARARDGDFNVQPETIEESYNVLGKCVNHWPRRKIIIDPKYKTGDELPPYLASPPPGQWEWKRKYNRVDIDEPEKWLARYEKEAVVVDTPTPPKAEWW